MTYDQWKTTDPADALRPCCVRCGSEEGSFLGFGEDSLCNDCLDDEAYEAREPLVEQDLDQIDYEIAEEMSGGMNIFGETKDDVIRRLQEEKAESVKLVADLRTQIRLVERDRDLARKERDDALSELEDVYEGIAESRK